MLAIRSKYIITIRRLLNETLYTEQMRLLRGAAVARPEYHDIDETNKQAQNATSLQKLPDKVALLPTFNLGAYVQKSKSLQEFVKLGVDLHQIERRKGLAQFMLDLQFDENAKHKLLFLQDQGVSADLLGQWLTKNPLIFKEDLANLQTRIQFLMSKKFTTEQISRLITQNPYWLMFSTQRIEKRLGFFQRLFMLSGDQVRALAAKQPRLITYNLMHVREVCFCVKEEMGFTADEIRELILAKPRLWLMSANMLVERFAFAHKTMGLSHEMLLKFPEVLCSRESRLRDRHDFLATLGRAQYDAKHDLYVCPAELVKGNDAYFCRHIAKCELATYEAFLRTR